ncbi:MAG: HAD family phosphatase, partial [Candidatus Aminicenantes bacterium]|nr:HAD family phosphatase [Candidatus Aminicenantes bacterium]
MIRAVIFDMGKVLVWFDNKIFLRKLADRAGLEAEKLRAIVHENLDLVRAFDRGEIAPAEFHQKVCAALGLEIEAGLFFEYYEDIFTMNIPVLQLVRRLKAAGYRLVLLSNTDVVRYAFIQRRFPETQIFDAYVLSYEVGLMKPELAIYFEAGRRAGVEPQECVFIDDLADNVEAARGAGMHGLHYTPETDLASE